MSDSPTLQKEETRPFDRDRITFYHLTPKLDHIIHLTGIAIVRRIREHCVHAQRSYFYCRNVFSSFGSWLDADVYGLIECLVTFGNLTTMACMQRNSDSFINKYVIHVFQIIQFRLSKRSRRNSS